MQTPDTGTAWSTPTLSVIIPVYNEARTLDELLRRVHAAPYDKQVLAVDDGSRDETLGILRRWESTHRVEVLRHAENRGKGAAIRTALPLARGRLTIIQDGDLELDPADYPRLIEPLLAGEAELVVGSRFRESEVGDSDVRGSESRRSASRGRKSPDVPIGRLTPPARLSRTGVCVLNVAARLLYGIRLTDEACCYKVLSTDTLRAMDLQCERFEFCPEVVAKAARLGLRIKEVPVSYHPRPANAGKKLRYRDGIAALAALWRWRQWTPGDRKSERLRSGIRAAEVGDQSGGGRSFGDQTSETPTSDLPRLHPSETPTSETPASETPTSDSPTSDPPISGDARIRPLVIVLLAVHAGLLAWGASRHSPTYDEVAYLPAGVSHWLFGRFELASVSPPLVRTVAAVPVVLAKPKYEWRHYDSSPSPHGGFVRETFFEGGGSDQQIQRSEQTGRAGTRAAHLVGRDFAAANGERTFRLFTLARWACIPFSLLGGYVCFAWGRELYGAMSGLLACALWCFSPNILAHGQLMTPDVGTAAFGIAAAYVFWRWMERPTWGRTFTAGIVLGLAQLTKSTLVVFFLLWPVLWAVRRRAGGQRDGVSASRKSESRTFRLPTSAALRSDRGRSDLRSPSLRQLAVILATALYVLNLGYGFQGTGKRLGDYTFVSRALSGKDNGEAGNRFAEWGLGGCVVPLPESYVRGVDFQKKQLENRGGGQRSYLRGQWQDHGWWYYYLYALAIKVPLGTWVLAVIALVTGVRSRRSERRNSERRKSESRRSESRRVRNRSVPTSDPPTAEAPIADPRCSHQGTHVPRSPNSGPMLLVPLIAILVLVSSQTGFNHHMRYVLPIFPFAFVWISRVGSQRLRESEVRGSKSWRVGGSEVRGSQVGESEVRGLSLRSSDLRISDDRRPRLRRPTLRTLIAAATLWSVGSSLLVYPHSLSYFNELAGGPEGGHFHLIDSNIDWGQDLLYLREWIDEHPEAVPISIAYFGNLSLEIAGLSAALPPGGGPTKMGETDFPVKPQEDETPCRFGPQPGWYAVSVNHLRGVSRGLNRDFRYFQRFTPVARAGYSILIYHITPDEADRVREELGLPRLDECLDNGGRRSERRRSEVRGQTGGVSDPPKLRPADLRDSVAANLT